MDQFLDLRIELAPPVNMPLNTLARIAVHCDAFGLHRTGMVLPDPLTQQERTDLRWYLEEYWQWPYEAFAIRGQQIEALLPDLGKRLYEAVFGSLKTETGFQLWLTYDNSPRQISIVSSIPQVLSLPWELLHDGQGFLALHPSQPISIARCLSKQEQTMLSIPFKPPLRILLVSPRPVDMGFIDPRSIASELLDEVQGQVEAGTIDLELLYPPTFQALSDRLKDQGRPVHILHFDGHGIFDEQGKQGVLAFENDGERLHRVTAIDLGKMLRQCSIQLVVLTACQSAVSASDNALSSVAAQLLQSEGAVDAVVAMSASLLIVSATRYTETFYRTLAAGLPVQVAHEQARQALSHDARRNPYRRYQDEESVPVELSDWWLPHFYQKTPLSLQAHFSEIPLEKRTAPLSHRLSKDMPKGPRYGFSGRKRELLLIERSLLRGKLVVISGFGGIGKTALTREAADWLTRTKRYDGACFISFRHGGDAATLLSTMGNYLDIKDAGYSSNMPESALSYLGSNVKSKKILVIADNLESILPNGEAPLEPEARAVLWDVLFLLAEMGMGVLLTSRDTIIRDELLALEKPMKHLPLQGLFPDDAYALATRLLTKLDINRARAPYKDLRDLLIQLDHHPLAIQLVLPMLRDMSLATILTEFATLLPKFIDDTETGHNQSLLASLDYSLQRLSTYHRTRLSLLAIFEGGAMADNLLAVTEISQSEWVEMQHALEQAALLTTERVEGFATPFLHFHPVLTAYLRNQHGAGDAALREHYLLRYAGLAASLSQQDNQNPLIVRALVKKELPNLLKTLGLMMDASYLEAASMVADCIADFLGYAGFFLERDKVRRTGEAVAAQLLNKQSVLTYAEYHHESSLGEDEKQQGNLRAAYSRFSSLLKRIETLPEGVRLGRGSFEHCLTLIRLARCLRSNRPAAEEYLLQAATMLDALVKQEPDNNELILTYNVLLSDLGGVLREQEKYLQASAIYTKALELARDLGGLRNQAGILFQLGTLSLDQGDYALAESRYRAALKVFRSLRESATEAGVLHQLGNVAKRQQNWVEAERNYRESLTISERLGDADVAAMTCDSLARVAKETGHIVEAIRWSRHTVALDEQAGNSNAEHLIHFASLLVDEVRAGHASTTHLVEAKRVAERALVISETLDALTPEILDILADIAEMEGQAEEARNYHRGARETYAALKVNRNRIDDQHERLITAIAAVAHGDRERQEAIEAVLPQLEANHWRIATAVHRIWAGERDWQTLVEEIDIHSALLILRMLETIASPGEEMAQQAPENAIDSLHVSILGTFQQRDENTLEQALAMLTLQEQRALSTLQELREQVENNQQE